MGEVLTAVATTDVPRLIAGIPPENELWSTMAKVVVTNCPGATCCGVGVKTSASSSAVTMAALPVSV